MYLSDGHLGSTKLPNFLKATFPTNMANPYSAVHFEYFSAYCLCPFCGRVTVNY